MECPSCRRPLPDTDPETGTSPEECPVCGVIFAKWHARQNRAAQPEAPQPAAAPAPVRSASYEPRPILESSSEDLVAFRVDGHLRTIFGILLLPVDPAVKLLHKAAAGRVALPPFVFVAVVGFGVGILVGMMARKRGYSEVLTPGGAGFLAGLVYGCLLLMLTPGTWMPRLQAALPAFGVYALYPFAGGVMAFALRKFVGVELK